MTEIKKPICYIIAGPNGSGKTTFALEYLPEIAGCRNFVNADLIAYGISPLNSIAVQYDAGRLFLDEVHKNISKRIDFAFETTLAGRSQINLLKKLRKDGWQIVLFFLWIPNADFSKDRVRQRVEEGGHDIPDDAIYCRYPRIMYNLVNIYLSLCDKVSCYDNSNPEPIPVFEQVSENQNIIDIEIYEKIARCANEYKKNK
ncbi:MAG: zeta toxin family protein [Anaerohalosphaeraceae bacterium]|nr:zeta toxin family protein [Anaerohalosphaeraceae bacterium]